MWADVSGERRQEANTESMLFDPAEIITYLSERFTFEADDVVAFGSPENPGLIEPGDLVEQLTAGADKLGVTVRIVPDEDSVDHIESSLITPVERESVFSMSGQLSR
jgi:2-keto-4-pentenoate hydratase/2-oxohepta-3-ene-1,7-dioic acid hydratase in catechol pathway